MDPKEARRVMVDAYAIAIQALVTIAEDDGTWSDGHGTQCGGPAFERVHQCAMDAVKHVTDLTPTMKATVPAVLEERELFPGDPALDRAFRNIVAKRRL